MSVIDLKEISPNVWKAIYKNIHVGMFLTKIKVEGEETLSLFCSCSSESKPCRHVSIVKEAVRQYKILSEFEQQTNNNSDDYSQVLRTVLEGIHIDYDEIVNIYIGRNMNIYIMDYLIRKAKKYVRENKFDQAVLICKTCIEEYALWTSVDDQRRTCSSNLDYQTKSFDLLTQILFMQEGKYVEDLFNYCRTEILKPQYDIDLIYLYFGELFMIASAMIGSKDYISFQEKVIDAYGIDSLEARGIGDSINNFYQYYNHYHKS